MGDPIYLASDHRGYALKQVLRERLEASAHDVCDLGTHGTESVDYPEDEGTLAGVRREAEALCGRFPLYSGRSSGAG